MVWKKAYLQGTLDPAKIPTHNDNCITAKVNTVTYRFGACKLTQILRDCPYGGDGQAQVRQTMIADADQKEVHPQGHS